MDHDFKVEGFAAFQSLLKTQAMDEDIILLTWLRFALSKARTVRQGVCGAERTAEGLRTSGEGTKRKSSTQGAGGGRGLICGT